MSTPDKNPSERHRQRDKLRPTGGLRDFGQVRRSGGPAEDWSAEDILMHEAGKLASKPTNKDGISVFDAVRLALALLLVEASKKDLLLEIGHVEPVTNTTH